MRFLRDGETWCFSGAVVSPVRSAGVSFCVRFLLQPTRSIGYTPQAAALWWFSRVHDLACLASWRLSVALLHLFRERASANPPQRGSEPKTRSRRHVA